MLAGAFGVALGLVLLGMLLVAPAPTLLVLAWIIGMWALASGISLLVLAFRLRSTRDRDTAERAETPVSDHRDGAHMTNARSSCVPRTMSRQSSHTCDEVWTANEADPLIIQKNHAVIDRSP
ncbi:MAG: DUF308 domain-containing protein [Erythrobacter sp.]